MVEVRYTPPPLLVDTLLAMVTGLMAPLTSVPPSASNVAVDAGKMPAPSAPVFPVTAAPALRSITALLVARMPAPLPPSLSETDPPLLTTMRPPSR